MRPTRLLNNCIFAVACMFPYGVCAEQTSYGAFVRYAELPEVLFLTGEIKSGDSFELRRAMRDHEVKLVVAASPGGNLYDGLQIAAILNDNDIGTFVPSGASCESSCANVFLGGTSRLVVGELGVHQFYSGAEDANSAASQSVTTAAVQYTTADIIGIMNGFGTPPFVYEKMFGTVEIYYFKESEKPLLKIDDMDGEIPQLISQVDTFILSKSDVLIKSRKVASAVDMTPVLQPIQPQIQPTQPLEPPVTSLEEEAYLLLTSMNQLWSQPNDQSLPLIPSYYAQTIDFYGDIISQAELVSEKEKFAKRWPLRQYFVEPGSAKISCTLAGCMVTSIINWSARSPERNAQASGRSTWDLVLMRFGGRLLISSETGKTISRN